MELTLRHKLKYLIAMIGAETIVYTIKISVDRQEKFLNTGQGLTDQQKGRLRKAFALSKKNLIRREGASFEKSLQKDFDYEVFLKYKETKEPPPVECIDYVEGMDVKTRKTTCQQRFSAFLGSDI